MSSPKLVTKEVSTWFFKGKDQEDRFSCTGMFSISYNIFRDILYTKFQLIAFADFIAQT
jgi:hypothetical protein